MDQLDAPMVSRKCTGPLRIVDVPLRDSVGCTKLKYVVEVISDWKEPPLTTIDTLNITELVGFIQLGFHDRLPQPLCPKTTLPEYKLQVAILKSNGIEGSVNIVKLYTFADKVHCHCHCHSDCTADHVQI